ncbi:MAG: hypothetical protein IJ480_01625 [Clostridia bacterium]|nr:hypothetical protein [Clostridia bacterium]
MNRHICAAVLALSLVAGSSSGCGLMVVNDLSGENILDHNKNIVSGETGAETEPETVTPFTPYEEENYDAQIEKYLSALPDLTFGGATVFITSPSFAYLEPEEADTAVSQLAYERNRALEDRYAVSLSTSTKDASVMLEEAKNAVASGSYYSDFLMVPLYMMGHFKSAGVLENLRSLPYLDMEQDYFYTESADALSAGYSTWGISGYASVSPSDLTAVFFSKDLIAEAGMEMPYSLVEEGSWTWDAFYAYVNAVQTLNGQSETPRYYTVTAQNTASRLADLVYTACGERFVLSGELLIPTISFTAETAAPAMEYASRIFGDERAITDSSAGATNCFSRGESLFLLDYVYVTSWLTNASADWGILPLPKLMEADSHETLVSNNSLVFTVPAGTVNTELCSVLLSAINAASYHKLNDAYVEHSMIYTLRDNESVNMLDMLLDTVTFDFAPAFGSAYPNIGSGTYNLIRETAASGTIAGDFENRASKANMVLAEYFPLG